MNISKTRSPKRYNGMNGQNTMDWRTLQGYENGGN